MKPATNSFRSVADFSIKLAGIITKVDNQEATEYAEQLSRWLQQKNIGSRINQVVPEMDILIILGGDGTLLLVAEEAARHSIPVLGINMGNLGFLTELTKEETEEALTRIIEGTVTVENRSMLRASMVNDNKDKGYRFALNDVVINKDSLDRILHLTTKANNEYITTYKTDGLIFSTPTGSTAYNLSAGGPLVYPGLASILVTPICPFMLGSRPILLPPDIEVATRFDPGNYRETANIIIDGQPSWRMEKDDTLIIETAKYPLRLIISHHRDYFEILRNKLHWGIQEEANKGK